MDVFDITTLYRTASLIMDGAALFILVGMIIYTSLYRKRGKTEDKVFFALILTNIIAAVFDGIIYIMEGFGIPVESGANTFCFSGFFLAVDAFLFLFAAYHMYRMEWETGKLKRALLLLLIPELILIILLFANVFTGNLYTGMIALGSIGISVYSVLDLVPVIICGILAVCLSFKRSRQMSVLILLFIAVHIFLTAASSTNVTPLFLSIYLMFTHLMAMRESFYEEAA